MFRFEHTQMFEVAGIEQKRLVGAHRVIRKQLQKSSML